MFTEEEFEDFRDTITNLITEDRQLNQLFKIIKSTYRWSKKYNWNIIISIRKNNYADIPVRDIISANANVLNKINNFIHNGYKNYQFALKRFDYTSFGYEFQFQLITARAIELLNV